MDLSKVKELINQNNFSEDSKAEMNKILDGAVMKKALSQEEKERLLAIIDLEIEAANLEADTLEELALALESFGNELDKTAELAEKETEKAEKDFDEDTEELVNKATSA